MHHCVVVEPEIEGNLGFLARTMANFDIEQLHLVDPQVRIGEEARDRAVHAQDLLDDVRIHQDLPAVAEQMDMLLGTTGIEATTSNILRNAMTPREAASNASSVDGDIAVVLGRESTGLSNEELDICDCVVTVPTSEEYPVMNITHAAAVVFYELFNHEEASETSEAGSRGQKQALENIFKSMMQKLDYSEPYEDRTLRCLRNVLGRSFLHGNEANTLIGFFKQVDQNLQGDT